MSKAGVWWIGLVLVIPAWSQKRVDGVHSVDPSTMYHRVYAVVPLIGAGTKTDPKRPMFTANPTAVTSPPSSQPVGNAVAPTGATGTISAAASPHTGILGYQMQISDDGQFALVEFVVSSPKDVPTVIDAAVPGVQVFQRGTSSATQIEAAFQQYKKGFQFSSFGVRAQ